MLHKSIYYIYIYIYIYIYVCVCMCVCVCMHTYLLYLKKYFSYLCRTFLRRLRLLLLLQSAKFTGNTPMLESFFVVSMEDSNFINLGNVAQEI